jgi:hypothetical protein
MAWLLDTLCGLGAAASGLIALLLGAATLLSAIRLQKSLVRRLAGPAPAEIRWLRLELEGSHFGLVWVVVDRAVTMARWLAGQWRRWRGAAPAGAATTEEPAPPLVVATLGPSYLLAALVTAALYLLSLLVAALLRGQLGLPAGTAVWEYLVFGDRPELGLHLPLSRQPFLACLLGIGVWLGTGGAVARLIRFLLQGALGSNLAAEEEDERSLSFWLRWAGATALWRPDASYSGWAVWVVGGAFPLLVWSWFSMGARPLRTAPSEVAVAFVVWLFWAIHLTLRGLRRIPAQAGPEPAPKVQANGWPEILDRLRERLQVTTPEEVRSPRAVEPLLLTQLPPEADAILSPLLLDLLPPPGRLTVMQRAVLTDLALQAFVHVEPPVLGAALVLQGAREEVLQDRSGLRHRNQIVVAPEAGGKTTLAVLAAANHALVHARSTLVVARDEMHEEEMDRHFRTMLEPSPIRWNLRVRRVGADLMSDLSLGIVPDVVVASLHDLVLHVLGNGEAFAPFLKSVGLLVVDDVELFCGPVEIHAQLVFRRLAARLRDLVGVQELGERSAPLVLALGAPTMRDMPAWVRALCGIDAVTRDFGRAHEEQEEREAADLAAQGFAVRPRTGPDEPTAASRQVRSGRHHLFYRLRDFRTAAGDFLDAPQLVEICESLAVPWHYRPCGDARRRLGRRPLLLRNEPKHCVDAPAAAAVVLLDGHWSEVRRERERLRRAGSQFSRWRRPGERAGEAPEGPEPIAFVSLVDPDEEMAFTQLDRRFGLSAVLEDLPEPVIRPPSGQIVQAHLAADLVQHWLEVAEVLGVFGAAAAQTLRSLARGGVLLTDRRIDVHPESPRYVSKVYVRALARAAGSLACAVQPATALLPPAVQQVELVSPDLVEIRDRSRQALVLDRVDAASAAFLCYPGRIFTDVRGSFVVVGRAVAEERVEGLSQEDLLVDSFLGDDVSSPRRRVRRLTRAELESLPAERIAWLAQPSEPPEMLLLGRCPLSLGLRPEAIAVRHVATYRLGPLHGEVRQRQLRRDERGERAVLFTWGLALCPNPQPEGEGDPGGAPLLTFAQARLIAAALRALLPSMVRNATDSLGVALLVAEPERPQEPGRALGSDEGFLFFDLEDGGNGTAMTLHRDGVEVILRLCRLLIERVLQPDRLLALHDDWGDEQEILAGGDLPSQAAEGDAREIAGERWKHYGELRKGALEWLDSRLRPEGRSEGAPGETGVTRGDFQSGEGDVIDLGRCWSSRNGAVSDLVWVKHRWCLPGNGEAMLDIAFDRTTVARARNFTERADMLAPYLVWHTAYLESEALRLPDGTVWGAPREVHLPVRGGERAEVSLEGCKDPAVPPYHGFAAAVAAHGWSSLGVLADTLRRCSDAVLDGQAGRLELLRFLSAFVQGIPFSIPDAVGGGLRPPVSTLLYRLGDCDSKSLLLALLAQHCGIDAGLFVSFPDRHAMAAVAGPDPAPARGESDDVSPHLAAWSALAGLSGPPTLWAEMPVSPEPGAPVQVYVPVESTGYFPLGAVHVDHPHTWAFLPLTTARLGLSGDGAQAAERKDRAELEGRS